MKFLMWLGANPDNGRVAWHTVHITGKPCFAHPQHSLEFVTNCRASFFSWWHCEHVWQLRQRRMPLRSPLTMGQSLVTFDGTDGLTSPRTMSGSGAMAPALWALVPLRRRRAPPPENHGATVAATSGKHTIRFLWWKLCFGNGWTVDVLIRGVGKGRVARARRRTMAWRLRSS